MRVIILAAGQQERWGDISCKQLVPINREPLLARTTRQCKKIFKMVPIVVTQDPLLLKLEDHLGYKTHFPARCRWAVETLRESMYDLRSRKGNSKFIVLLGDVYYTNATLKTIKKGKTLAYGDSYEIYGLKITDYIKAKIALMKAIANAEEGGRGKLWEFYRSYIDIPMTPHVEWLSTEYTFIDDETQDFDKYEEYLEWKECLDNCKHV